MSSQDDTDGGEQVGRTRAILLAVESGNSRAADELFPLVYAELRRAAQAEFRRQPSDHTLEPTAVVHEVYLRMVQQDDARWRGRAHFIAVAAKAMRQILVDHSRRRKAAKRGGEWRRVTLTGAALFDDPCSTDALALEEAMVQLAGHDERKCRVVELRFYGGLTNQEAAEVLGVSAKTVEADWYFARAWLRNVMLAS